MDHYGGMVRADGGQHDADVAGRVAAQRRQPLQQGEPLHVAPGPVQHH